MYSYDGQKNCQIIDKKHTDTCQKNIEYFKGIFSILYHDFTTLTEGSTMLK